MIVKIHPLALVNISDHYLRSLSNGSVQKQEHHTVGALCGKQEGNVIEIFTSYELLINVDSNDNEEVALNFFNTEKEQFKQVFKYFDYVGWYSVEGGIPTMLKIHNQLQQSTETPLFMRIDPNFIFHSSSTESKNVPVEVYETAFETKDGKPSVILNAISEVSFVTGEAERISLDLLTNMHQSNADKSAYSSYLSQQKSLLGQMVSKVSLLKDYVKNVKEGKVSADPRVLRQINSIRSGLKNFNFSTLDYDDALYASTLGAITKGTDILNEFAEKLTAARNSSQKAETHADLIKRLKQQ